jgi:hypothetical protein
MHEYNARNSRFYASIENKHRFPNRHSKSSFDNWQHIKAGASDYIEMLEFNPLENLLQTFVSICFKEYDYVCRYRITVKGTKKDILQRESLWCCSFTARSFKRFTERPNRHMWRQKRKG